MQFHGKMRHLLTAARQCCLLHDHTEAQSNIQLPVLVAPHQRNHYSFPHLSLIRRLYKYKVTNLNAS